MSDQISIRHGQPADYALIYNSFLKSYRDSPYTKGIPNTQYFSGHHKLIERALPLSIIRVACDSAKPTEIFGYAIAQATMDGLSLHWVYVKHAFRGFGIAKMLESELLKESNIKYYTHRVKNMEGLLKDRDYIYNPYLFYR